MAKNYTAWTAVKVGIENTLSRPIGFKRREIWICSIGENIGQENDGKGVFYARPVLILKAYGNKMCHVVPLSTTSRRGDYYYEFDGHTGKMSVALLTQSRVIDSARLRRRIGKADKADFDIIMDKVVQILRG